MQIVIPMSGFGERFKKAGYTIPKPLIEIDNKPIIEHVVNMFPGEINFIFICNKDHLNSKKLHMREILKKISPQGVIVAIDPHNQGPVYAVLKAINNIDPNEPTIVNYADFTCYWNYSDFNKMIKQTDCDGAIPCYKGFHPHTIWSNYYAYVSEKNFKALDIQEKKPFTNNPIKEFASSGTYYFKSGNIMHQYFEKCINRKLLVNGEYYVSMVYKSMIEEGLNIQVYKLQHFMQWGTPIDLEEYKYWSKCFKLMLNKQETPYHEGTIMIPMVGQGNRFKTDGYKTPKPLIQVSGQSMAYQALMDLPKAKNNRIIVRSDLTELKTLKNELNVNQNNIDCVVLNHMTDGQAITCVEGSKNLNQNQPITISACDNGMRYNARKFSELFKLQDVDVIVWGARGYPGANRSPKMYGWIDVENSSGIIKNVSVKKPLFNTAKDPIIVGTFTFKKLTHFLMSVQSMKNRNARVNGEYYIDTAINDAISNGLKCVLFEIEAYICWGTPNDLKTFEYWQACFHKWKSHPYKFEKDYKIVDLNKVRNIFL